MSQATTQKAPDESNIVILPESDDRTLCVSLSGVLSIDDYEARLYQPLSRLAKNGKRYGLLIHYTKDYKGWSKEAADRSFQSIIDYGKQARKLAYVNPPESKIFQIKMARDLFGGETRFFEENELKKALKWIKE